MPDDLRVGLKLTADGKGFVATVKGGADALDKLRKETDDVGDSTERTERKLKGFARVWAKFSREFRTGFSSFVSGGLVLGAIQRGLGAVSRSIQAAGRHIVSSGLQVQTWTQRLRAATGTAEGAQDALAFLRAETDRLGIDLGASAHAFSGFAAAARGTALEGAAAREVFSGVAEAAATMGRSARTRRRKGLSP